MLTFKEFVFASWDVRKYGPHKDLYEASWQLFNKETNANGWWKRYQGWQKIGCPIPVEDIDYHKLPEVTSEMNEAKPVQAPPLSLSEYYAAKINASLGANTFIPEDFQDENANVKTAWQNNYVNWIKNGCPPIKMSPFASKPKKQIRYLNRV